MAARRDRTRLKTVAKKYIENGFNMTKAIVETEGKPIGGHYLAVKTSRWKLSPEFQDQLRKELSSFDRKLFNSDYIYSKAIQMIEDETIKESVRFELLKLLAECEGLRSDSKIQNVQVIGSDRLKNIIDTTKVEPNVEGVKNETKASSVIDSTNNDVTNSST